MLYDHIIEQQGQRIANEMRRGEELQRRVAEGVGNIRREARENFERLYGPPGPQMMVSAPTPKLPPVGKPAGYVDAPPRGLGCGGTVGHPWTDMF